MPVYTAQELLDQLHSFDYSDLFIPALAVNIRKAKIKLFKQKLKALKQSIRAEQQTIKARWNARKSDEAIQQRLEMSPYEAIQTIIDRMEIGLSEIELAIEAATPIPEPSIFGTKIFEEIVDGTYTLQIVDEHEYVELQLKKERREQERLLEQSESRIRDEAARRRSEQIFHDIRRGELSTGEAVLKLLESEPPNPREQMLIAKDYIEQGRYDAARLILQSIDHPKAREWIDKINEHEGFIERKQESTKKKPPRTFFLLLIVGLLLVVAGIVLSKQSNVLQYSQADSYVTADPNNPDHLTDTPFLVVKVTSTANAYTYPTRSPTRYIPATRIPSYGGGGSTCADGTHSKSTGRGTCSHHGGVR